MLDVVAVNPFLFGEGLEMFVVCGGCQGELWLAVKVVMVIMTSDGFPLDVPYSLSTG